MKQRIRLTESDLQRIISESVKRVMNEVSASTVNNYVQGRLAQSRGERDASPAKWRKYGREFRNKEDEEGCDYYQKYGITMHDYVDNQLGKEAERTSDREQFNYNQAASRGLRGGDATYRGKQAEPFGKWNA